VRKHDYEGYLLHPFFPKETQGDYLSLRAFYVELASVFDKSGSNALIGKMKLQWWRDVVKAMSEGKSTRHPIALALFEASQRSHLAPYHLKRIIDARETELENPTHFTVDSLTAHAESTSSTMLYLLLSVLRLNAKSGDKAYSFANLSRPHDHSPAADPYDPDTLAHAASHLGVAQTIATLLRALPFHASHGRLVVPAEITARHGVRDEDVFRHGGEAKGIDDAVYELACVAHGHLGAAREMFAGQEGGKVPARAAPVFLAGVPVASYLGRLEAADFDAFSPSLLKKDWKLPWRIWRASSTRVF
jgi:NADH dehydrogenase [ubiquinone] 1 alpha subcomplex assembly factor 6